MSIPADGLSDNDSSAPPRASTPTIASVTSGRRDAAPTSRSNLSPTVILSCKGTGALRRPAPVSMRLLAQSIVSGPWDSPERNCRMNGFSELSMSSAGPASTIRPFHSTLM